MSTNKKITILVVALALAGAGVLGYKVVLPLLTKKSASLPVLSTVQQVRQQEFNDALKKASASDQDMDGISDSDEINIYHTSPTSSDTDGDGLSDRDEIFIYKTNPLKADTDGDGQSDGYEVRHGTDPNKPNK